MPEPTANEELLNRTIRHQVYLERFKASELPRLIRELDALDRDLLGQLAAVDPESLTGQRLEAQIAKVSEISDEATRRYSETLLGSLSTLGAYEASWAAATIASTAGAEFLVVAGLDITTPDPNLLRAAIFSRPLQGKLLEDWVADLEKARRDRLSAAIRMAAIESQTIDQLVRRIRGTRANGYKDGILDISRRGAEALARTAMQHISNSARAASYEQNASVIDEVQMVATLDGRTTPYCRGIDGKRFPRTKGPRPPFHINCRTTTVPVLKSWAEIGIQANELSASTRASMNGQVADTLDYDAWLRGQSSAFQDDVLGPSRADLFRKGGLHQDRFVDFSSQRQWTLKELREREPDAWRATFGDRELRAGG